MKKYTVMLKSIVRVMQQVEIEVDDEVDFDELMEGLSQGVRYDTDDLLTEIEADERVQQMIVDEPDIANAETEEVEVFDWVETEAD